MKQRIAPELESEIRWLRDEIEHLESCLHEAEDELDELEAENG